MGHSIFNITAPEDHEKLRMHISPDGLSDPEWRKYFTLYLKKAGPRTESPVYELCSVVGMERSVLDDSELTCSSPSTSLQNKVEMFA